MNNAIQKFNPMASFEVKTTFGMLYIPRHTVASYVYCKEVEWTDNNPLTLNDIKKYFEDIDEET